MIYKTSTRIDFGKYLGFRLDEVITANPGYVRWALRNVNGFYITNKARRLLDAKPVRVRRRVLRWTWE